MCKLWRKQLPHSENDYTSSSLSGTPQLNLIVCAACCCPPTRLFHCVCRCSSYELHIVNPILLLIAHLFAPLAAYSDSLELDYHRTGREAVEPTDRRPSFKACDVSGTHEAINFKFVRTNSSMTTLRTTIFTLFLLSIK